MSGYSASTRRWRSGFGSDGRHENMITVTRLDDRVVVINAELIKMIESTPDTIITLINGDTLIVRENVDEVVRRAIDYARQIRGFQVV